MLTPQEVEDLEDILSYICEIELDDYLGCLKEEAEEDLVKDVYKIEADSDWIALDALALDPESPCSGHTYARAIRVWKALRREAIT